LRPTSRKTATSVWVASARRSHARLDALARSEASHKSAGGGFAAHDAKSDISSEPVFCDKPRAAQGWAVRAASSFEASSSHVPCSRSGDMPARIGDRNAPLLPCPSRPPYSFRLAPRAAPDRQQRLLLNFLYSQSRSTKPATFHSGPPTVSRAKSLSARTSPPLRARQNSRRPSSPYPRPQGQLAAAGQRATASVVQAGCVYFPDNEPVSPFA